MTVLYSKEEVRNESLRALNMQTATDTADSTATATVPYPGFADIMFFLNEQAAQRLRTSRGVTIGNTTLPFSVNTHVQCAMYVRQCLAVSGGQTAVGESVGDLQTQAPLLAQYVNELLDDMAAANHPVLLYMDFLRQLLLVNTSKCAVYCHAGVLR
jgi:hypothetical protein